MPHRKRTDANQGKILKALRSIGAGVIVTSDMGDGFPDAVVAFRGALYLLEIKNPDNWYGRAGLSSSQQAFVGSLNGVPVAVVYDAQEALRCIGAIE